MRDARLASPRPARAQLLVTVLALVTAALLATPHARAQVAPATACAEGHVVGPLTQGRCCWPGQRWNAADARCEGPPACPAG